MATVDTSVAAATVSPGTTAIVCLGLCWMNLIMPAKDRYSGSLLYQALGCRQGVIYTGLELVHTQGQTFDHLNPTLEPHTRKLGIDL